MRKSSKEDLYIEPTILENINVQDKVMQEEIFGPILPILTYDSFDEAIEIIQSKPKPLSLYLFEDENASHRVLDELSFGGGAINDTLMHVANLIYHLVVLVPQVLDNITVNIHLTHLVI